MNHPLVLAALLAPLALDTFALSAAIGMLGPSSRERLRLSLVLAVFEGGMPIVGFFAGGLLGRTLGRVAGYGGIAFLLIAGAMLLRPDGEEAEERRVRLLARARGLALVDLGLGISVDELTIGFSLGLLGISLVMAVAWIAVQALVAAQLGMRLGARVSEALRERAEQLAGVSLIVVALVLLGLRLT